MGCTDGGSEHESYEEAIDRQCRELNCTENELLLARMIANSNVSYQDGYGKVIKHLREMIKFYINNEEKRQDV